MKPLGPNLTFVVQAQFSHLWPCLLRTQAPLVSTHHKFQLSEADQQQLPHSYHTDHESLSLSPKFCASTESNILGNIDPLMVFLPFLIL